MNGIKLNYKTNIFINNFSTQIKSNQIFTGKFIKCTGLRGLYTCFQNIDKSFLIVLNAYILLEYMQTISDSASCSICWYTWEIGTIVFVCFSLGACLDQDDRQKHKSVSPQILGNINRLGQMCQLGELVRKQANRVEQRSHFMRQVNRSSLLGVFRR